MREHRFKCCVSLKNKYEFRGCDHFSLKDLLKEVECNSEDREMVHRRRQEKTLKA